MNTYHNYNHNYDKLYTDNNFNNMNPYNYENNYTKSNYATSENYVTLFSPYDGFIRGNMFSNFYSPYKIEKPYQIEPLNEQAEMLTNIDMLSFAALDLSLYLDVHPDDKDMINLFNEYREQAGKATMEYEKKYGPINKSSSPNNAYPWMWNNTPWPWDN